MDTKFQTSFIPKKPIVMDQRVVKHSGGTSVLMFIAVIIFIVSLAGAGFTFVWKDILLRQQDTYVSDLKKAQNRFDIGLIEKLKKANTKIDLGAKLLKKHLAISEVFSIISSLTADSVRFTDFQFVAPTIDGDEAKITMKGFGNSYPSVAWQSDVFGQSSKYGKNKILKNLVLSDPVVDLNGNVVFTFTATLNPDDISYEKSLASGLNNPTQ